MGFMHHANGKLPPAAAAPNTNHTTPYESSIHNSHGSSNAGDLNNDWGTKPGLVASEKATVVTIEREGTVDNKPYIDDPHLGFNSNGNGSHPNNGFNNVGSEHPNGTYALCDDPQYVRVENPTKKNESIIVEKNGNGGLYNNGSGGFPPSKGLYNQNTHVGSQADGNNSLENNTNGGGLYNNGSGGFPSSKGLYNQNTHVGSQADGNNSLENNTGSIGSNNVGSAFPQSNGVDNHDYAGSQNDGNNSLENNTGSVGLNNNGSAVPQSNGADNHDYVGSQNDGNNGSNTSSGGLTNGGSKNIDPAGDPFIERRENDGLGDTPLPDEVAEIATELGMDPAKLREFFRARGWDDETDGDSCSSSCTSCSSIGTLSSDYGLGDGPPSWCSDPLWEKVMLQEQAMELLDDSMRTQDRAPQTYDTTTLTYNDNSSLTEPPHLLHFQPDPPALYNSPSNDSREWHEVDNTVAAAAPNTNHTTPYESSIHHGVHGSRCSSNAGQLNNDWGAKPGLVASERATGVTIEREGTVDNKPPQSWVDQHPLYNSPSNDSRDREEDNAVTNHAENPLDDISIAVVSIASENEDDTNTNVAPHHCMPTLRDASGSRLDTIREDIVQEDTNAAPDHCMPTLRDSSGSIMDILDTIREDIGQERITRYVKKKLSEAILEDVNWGAKPGLVAPERATVVTIERDGTVDNKPSQIWIDKHPLYNSMSNESMDREEDNAVTFLVSQAILEDVLREHARTSVLREHAKAPVSRVSKNDTSSTQRAEVPAVDSAGDDNHHRSTAHFPVTVQRQILRRRKQSRKVGILYKRLEHLRVTAERPEAIHEPGGLEKARLDWNWQEERNLLPISKSNPRRLATSLSEMILSDIVFHLRKKGL